jgi:hypothetical protein
MSASNYRFPRSLIRPATLLALGCAFGLAIGQVPVAGAAAAVLYPRDDKAPSLPLTSTFDKGTDPNEGPYVLNLKNVSKDSLKVSVSIHLSVAFHANKKDRTLPDHVIEPDQVWTVSDLAAGDKVTVTADGYSPLELTVP